MNRKKKKILLSFILISGLLFQFIGICSGTEHNRMLSGIYIGIGSILFSLSINKLYRLSYEKKFPDAVHQEQIEKMDERNVQIRNQARAKTNNISRWAMIGLAWVNFLVYGPLWITLILMCWSEYCRPLFLLNGKKIEHIDFSFYMP